MVVKQKPKHYLVAISDAGAFYIIGKSHTFNSLQDLLTYYAAKPISATGPYLSLACPKPDMPPPLPKARPGSTPLPTANAGTTSETSTRKKQGYIELLQGGGINQAALDEARQAAAASLQQRQQGRSPLPPARSDGAMATIHEAPTEEHYVVFESGGVNKQALAEVGQLAATKLARQRGLSEEEATQRLHRQSSAPPDGNGALVWMDGARWGVPGLVCVIVCV